MKFRELLDLKPKCFLCKFIILLSFIIILTGTDLLVKELANQKLKGKNPVPIIKGFWYHYYVTNDDIGFSILNWISSFLSKNQKVIFLIFLQGFGTIVVLLFYIYSNKIKQLIPLALIISGALGNLIDRIIRGYVVDYVMWFFPFIPLKLFNPWPIFNLADVYTVIGAILLFIVLFFFTHENENNDLVKNNNLIKENNNSIEQNSVQNNSN